MVGAQLMYLEQMSKVEMWVNCSWGAQVYAWQNVGFSVLGAGFGFDIDRCWGGG